MPKMKPPRDKAEKKITLEDVEALLRKDKPVVDEPVAVPAKPDIIREALQRDEYDDIPVVDIDKEGLPSHGLSYPDGYSISYRPYVFGEIKRVSGSQTGFLDLAKIVLRGLNTSFDVGDLTYYDFLNIALKRKLSTLGDSKVVVSMRCPHKDCGAENSYEIDVAPNKCDIEFWDLDYTDLPISVDMKLSGDVEFKTYEFSPLTIRGYLELERDGKSKDDIARLAKQCVNVPFEEAYHKFSRAQYDDMQLLDIIEEKLFHGIKPIEAVCANCGRNVLIRLEGGGVIIRPFRSLKTSLDDRIHYGKKDVNSPGDSS